MPKTYALEKSKIGLKSWVLVIVLSIIWGSSFILMKRGLFDASGNTTLLPAQLAGLRLSIAGLALLPVAIRHLKAISRDNWKFLLIVGLCGNGIPAFLFAVAQTHISSSLSGLLNSLVPLFTMLLGYLVFKIKTKWFNALGVFIGLGGALGLIFSSNSSEGESDFWFSMLIVLATVCYAISVNVIKSKLQDVKALAITSIGFGFLFIPIVFYLGTTDLVLRLDVVPGAWASVGYVSILSLVGTGLAVILFNELVKETTAIFASSVTYLIPIVAIAWGVLDGEQLSGGQILFALVILSGVYLVNKKEGSRL